MRPVSQLDLYLEEIVAVDSSCTSNTLKNSSVASAPNTMQTRFALGIKLLLTDFSLFYSSLAFFFYHSIALVFPNPVFHGCVLSHPQFIQSSTPLQIGRAFTILLIAFTDFGLSKFSTFLFFIIKPIEWLQNSIRGAILLQILHSLLIQVVFATTAWFFSKTKRKSRFALLYIRRLQSVTLGKGLMSPMSCLSSREPSNQESPQVNDIQPTSCSEMKNAFGAGMVTALRSIYWKRVDKTFDYPSIFEMKTLQMLWEEVFLSSIEQLQELNPTIFSAPVDRKANHDLTMDFEVFEIPYCLARLLENSMHLLHILWCLAYVDRVLSNLMNVRINSVSTNQDTDHWMATKQESEALDQLQSQALALEHIRRSRNFLEELYTRVIVSERLIYNSLARDYSHGEVAAVEALSVLSPSVSQPQLETLSSYLMDAVQALRDLNKSSQEDGVANENPPINNVHDGGTHSATENADIQGSDWLNLRKTPAEYSMGGDNEHARVEPSRQIAVDSLTEVLVATVQPVTYRLGAHHRLPVNEFHEEETKMRLLARNLAHELQDNLLQKGCRRRQRVLDFDTHSVREEEVEIDVSPVAEEADPSPPSDFTGNAEFELNCEQEKVQVRQELSGVLYRLAHSQKLQNSIVLGDESESDDD